MSWRLGTAARVLVRGEDSLAGFSRRLSLLGLAPPLIRVLYPELPRALTFVEKQGVGH